jgi:hypothetical protein
MVFLLCGRGVQLPAMITSFCRLGTDEPSYDEREREQRELSVEEFELIAPGMSVLDIGSMPVGVVSAVHRDNFEIRLYTGIVLTLRSDALFWVSHMGVALVCSLSTITRYAVR